MQINPVKHIGETVLTQGQFSCHCCRFKSDLPLTGLRLYVNPGVFVDSINYDPDASKGYTLLYPSAAGTYAMPLQGISSIYNNLSATLTVISSTEFVIEYCFVVGRVVGYLDNYTYDSYNQLFLPVIGSYYLDIKITVVSADKLISSNCFKEVKVNNIKECDNYYLSINGKSVNGWQQGSDLEIDFTLFDGVYDDIFYAGIIRVDNATNSQRFIEDLKLNYSNIGNLSGTGTPLIPYQAFADGRVIWQNSTGFSNGKVKIDKDYFEEGGEYRVYFVVKNFCEWQSCYTAIIEEEIVNTCPILDFEFTPIVLNLQNGVTYDKEAYININPCKVLDAGIKIDKTIFDAELLSKGYNIATFDNSFTGIKVYATNSLAPNAAKEILNGSLYSYVTGNTDVRTYGFRIPDEWAGKTKYLFFEYDFSIEGNDYEIIIPIQFNVNNYSNDITLSSALQEYYCFENPQDVEICFNNANDTQNFYIGLVKNGELDSYFNAGITLDGPTFDGNKGCITVPYVNLEEDAEYCIKVMGEEDLVCDDVCPCDYIDIKWETEYKDGKRVTSLYSLLAFPAIDILNFKITDATGYEYFSNSAGSAFILLAIDGNEDQYYLNFDVTLKNGCIYHVEQNVYNPDYGDIKLWLCNDGTPPGTLAVPCEKDPILETVCISNQWDSMVGADGGTVLAHEYSFDYINWIPYTSPVPFGANELIYIKYIIDYGLPCGEVTLFQCIKACDSCFGILPVNQCEEMLSVYHSISGNYLILYSSESCIPVYDSGIMYSTDGLIWIAYTSPIDTSGIGKIYYRRYIECADGCSVEKNGTWDMVCLPCGQSNQSNPDSCSVRIIADSENCSYTLKHYNPFFGELDKSFESNFILLAGFRDRSLIESRVRVDFLNSCEQGVIEECYYKQQGYYVSEYTNDLALQTGGFIQDITVYRHDPSTSLFAITTITLTAITFAGSGTAFATAIRAAIVTALNAVPAIDTNNYVLTVTCTNAGFFKIRFLYRDNDLGLWIGINKTDARLRYRQTAAGALQTRTHTANQGCPLYILNDPFPFCTYTDPCGAQLKFKAIATGGTTCGSADYVFIEDTNIFNFHRVPLLKQNPYTIDAASVLSSICKLNTLVAIPNNFLNQVTYTWTKGAAILGTQIILKTFETGIIEIAVTDGTCSDTDSISI